MTGHLDLLSLDLVPEEAFVLSRIDGSTPAEQLSFMTRLPADRVADILRRLVELGAVEPPAGAGVEPTEARAEPSDQASEGVAGDEGNWRRYFQRHLSSLSVDQRVERARDRGGVELRALCFDPSPKVAAALFENQDLGLEHARLLARHHRTSQGLSCLAQDGAFLRDRQVMADLFRNPQAPETLLRRIFQGQSLHQVHSLAVGHNATERVRRAARESFRKGFSRGSADERSTLILRTEGRCLALLSGVPLDGKTTAVLIRRPVTSALLVRNLARWPSTTPPLLQHLARQALVKRNMDLKNQVLRHPNAPSNLSF